MNVNKEKLVKKAKKAEITEAKIENEKSININKKAYYILGIVVFVLVLLGVIWYLKPIEKKDTFKVEYEELNGKFNDKSNKYYTNLKLENTGIIKYSNYEEIFKILESGTGVIYFGFPECPWCRTLIPNLLTAAKNSGIERIYYLNNKEDRDIKTLDENGKIVVEKEGTADYNKLVKKLENYLGVYEGLNDDSIKRLYFPTVIFVRDGKIVDLHIGTIDSQSDPYLELTTDEKQELINTLEEKMNKTITCDEAC